MSEIEEYVQWLGSWQGGEGKTRVVFLRFSMRDKLVFDANRSQVKISFWQRISCERVEMHEKIFSSLWAAEGVRSRMLRWMVEKEEKRNQKEIS